MESQGVDIQVAQWDNDHPIFFSRGHHDPIKFLDALEKYSGERLYGVVRHTWHRFVPCSSGDYGFSMLFIESQGPQKGAFRTTCLDQ